MWYSSITWIIDWKHQLSTHIWKRFPHIDIIAWYAHRIDELLRFPWAIVKKYSHNPEGLDERIFSMRYFSGWKNWINGGWSEGTHLEWPHNLVLYKDQLPICNVAYKYTYDGILIVGMQGIRPWQNQKNNWELEKLDWTRILVSIIERIADIRWKQWVYILSAHSNHWYHYHTNHDQFVKIYNQTAKDLWYEEYLGKYLWNYWEYFLLPSKRFVFWKQVKSPSII